MKLVTSEQMAFLEKTAIDEYGVPGIVLMENAAMGFCRELKKHIDLKDKHIGIFCGKGNNGGDGFAISRLLSNDGFDVSCIISFNKNDAKKLLTNDAYTNYSIAEKMQIPIGELNSEKKYDIIIDALLGTGIKGAPREKETDMISFINNSGAYVASVDIPSGANATGGKVEGVCVNADVTITFCLAKTGHFMYPAKEYVGKLFIVPISVPRNIILEFESRFTALDDEIFSYLPERKENSHKGTFGKVLAFCGSAGMSGAAMLSVSAAFKSGVGMVTALSDDDVLKNIVINTPEAMTLSLGGASDEKILDTLLKNDALLLGCGIGKSERSKHLTELFIENSQIPMVCDADGINHLSSNIDILYKKKAPIVLTPHLVEFSRLTGLAPEEIEKDKMALALSFAEKYGACLVLKGADTIIATPDKKAYICPVSNSGMATAGSGDVLAGIIAGFLAQGIEPTFAAAAGVYVHSKAGLFARDMLGEKSMTASDIVSAISKILIKTK